MKQRDNDWKSRLGIVYSTANDFAYQNTQTDDEPTTLPPQQQKLHVQLERRNRGGKAVTIVSGFIGTENDLKELGKTLKTKCGVGGSTKDGEIIVQGELVDKVKKLLTDSGYKVR